MACVRGGPVPRVIAGRAGGRPLAVPSGNRTRPTSDRAREGLFSALQSLLDLDGARVLDLYAGTGAVGLEALSRGAAHALLVDSDARALRTLRANARALGLPGATVLADKAERLVARPPDPGEPYDVAYLDPPYAAPVQGVLADLVGHGWVGSGSVLVVERASRDADLVWPQGVEALRSRRYGEATLWYGRRS